MKSAYTIAYVSVCVFSLVACGQKEATKEAPQKPASPPIPTMTVNEILDMSKNERQELERRCLGVSHPTCSELKSDSYQKLKEFRLSLCRLGASQKGLTDRYEAAKAERKCDEMF